MKCSCAMGSYPLAVKIRDFPDSQPLFGVMV